MKLSFTHGSKLLLSSCIAFLIVGCQAQSNFQSNSGPVITAASDPAITQTGLDIVEAVQQWLSAQNTSGSVAVSYQGKPLIRQDFGRSAETPYPVASLSKAITAVCMQDLLDKKQLSNTLTLNSAIPELITQHPPADSRLGSVTMAQLITHNSGIHSRYHRDYISDNRAYARFDMNAQYRALAKEKMTANPGSGYHYSNANYLLLGLAIESISGQAYDEYCNESILKPAGINADMNPQWQVMSAWGGWRISATDYLKFLNAYFSNNKVLGKQLDWYNVSAPLGRGASYGHGVMTRQVAGGNRFWHAGAWRWRSQFINDRFGAYFVTREDSLMVSVNYATAAQDEPLVDLQKKLVAAMNL